jgi:predicted nuclease with TOPRIM domain
LDWNEVTKTALTVAGSGGSAFLGAFFRFKQRLKDAETNAAEALAEAQTATADLAVLRSAHENLAAGWRLEFNALKDDFQRELAHRTALEEAREEGRASRRDPTEDLRDELEELKKQLERLKERQARYVRSETFVEHTKAQETQWKEIARTLGRLEALAR